MKKIALLIFSLMLCGCSKTTENVEKQNNVYKDGTYTSTAQGYGGSFEVKTTLRDDKIINIEVKDHNETPSIGGVAIEQIINQMKEANSYEIDVISGATKTSQGMIEAVKDAVENAKTKTE